jgi:hypothetical protein
MTTDADPDDGDDLTSDLISLDELCRMGRMGRDAYRNLRRQGRTPTAWKLGRRLYFKRSDAEAWLLSERMVRIDPPARRT